MRHFRRNSKKASRGGGAEWIRQPVAHRVPVARREAQLVAHGLALDELVGTIVAETEGLLRGALDEGDRVDAGESVL
jgi:hypothetical protein